jgi:L-fuculose-phosphate aldolase
MIGEPLAVAHMDSAVFWDDCACLPEWPGVPIGDEEGRIISGVLGDKRAALLAHHGLVTACGTVEEAAILALFLERTARLQLMARAAGTIKPIGAGEAQEAHDYRLRASIIGATFCYFARRVLKDDPAIV